MHPILFKIGEITLYTHGVFAVLGICLGAFLMYNFAKKAKLDPTLLFDNIIYSVLIGIIFARLTYFLLYRSQFGSWNEIFYLWNGGMVSYGGFVAGFLTFYFLLKNQKENIWAWLDIGALAFPAGLVFGRIGNLFAGEYSGIPTSSHFSLGGVVPVTLYEGILDLFIFVILFMIARYKYRSGLIFPLLLVFYGAGRLIIDFWRDEQILFFHISLGQLISVLIAIAGMAIWWLNLKTKRKHSNEII